MFRAKNFRFLTFLAMIGMCLMGGCVELASFNNGGNKNLSDVGDDKNKDNSNDDNRVHGEDESQGLLGDRFIKSKLYAPVTGYYNIYFTGSEPYCFNIAASPVPGFSYNAGDLIWYRCKIPQEPVTEWNNVIFHLEKGSNDSYKIKRSDNQCLSGEANNGLPTFVDCETGNKIYWLFNKEGEIGNPDTGQCLLRVLFNSNDRLIKLGGCDDNDGNTARDWSLEEINDSNNVLP